MRFIESVAEHVFPLHIVDTSDDPTCGFNICYWCAGFNTPIYRLVLSLETMGHFIQYMLVHRIHSHITKS